ncbi:MAG TPA: copper resistance protein CopC [Solirubrobacteraceae bacterium]|nr:copper resistance protein CopC [Solirubrobacteraceae bacterium]
MGTGAPCRRLHRRIAAVVALATLVVVLAVPATAAAHAVLERSTPSFGAVVHAEPHRVTLRYDEEVVPRLAQVSVVTPAGRDLAGTPQVAGSTVTVALRAGPRGSYTVRWRMVAADDGHVTEGAFSFGVDAKPVAPVPAQGASIPVAPEALAWLQFIAIVLAGGMLTFRAAVLVPAARVLGSGQRGAGDARLAIGLGIAGAILGLHAALFSFLVGAYPAVGGGVSNFVGTEIIPLRVSTHSGQAFTLSSFAWLLAAALIVAAWCYPRRREPLLGIAGLLSLAIAFGLSWASHPAGRGTLTLAADYAHLLGAALWVGGLIALAILAGAVRASAATDRDALFRACLLRFSALAAPVVAVLAAAAVYLAIRELPAVSALFDSRYGILILAKTATFAAAIALAGYHRRAVVPRVAAGAPAATVRRTLVVEAGVLLVTLVLAAILSQSAPPG